MLEHYIRTIPLLQKICTICFGWLARQTHPLIKNYCITRFAQKFGVNWDEALYSDPTHYKNFNAFFSRHLKPGVRPLAPLPAMISPVDGFISALGTLTGDTIFQAKNHDYSLWALLAHDSHYTQVFENGSFATLYLSPKDYHRVHMPLDGRLVKMTFVPGTLFSVNPETVSNCPDLFARNERLICYFETAYGPMAIILIGALNVSSLFTQWSGIVRSRTVQQIAYDDQSIKLARGDEMGGFLMGSTVIVLMPLGSVVWDVTLCSGDSIRLGQLMGVIS